MIYALYNIQMHVIIESIKKKNKVKPVLKSVFATDSKTSLIFLFLSKLVQFLWYPN